MSDSSTKTKEPEIAILILSREYEMQWWNYFIPLFPFMQRLVAP